MLMRLFEYENSASFTMVLPIVDVNLPMIILDGCAQLLFRVGKMESPHPVVPGAGLFQSSWVKRPISTLFFVKLKSTRAFSCRQSNLEFNEAAQLFPFGSGAWFGSGNQFRKS